jgi:hypothetical protein
MENATGETESVEAQVDVVVLAKKHLEAHAEACVWATRANVAQVETRAGQKDRILALHQHGSADCIAAFLGEGSPAREGTGEGTSRHADAKCSPPRAREGTSPLLFIVRRSPSAPPRARGHEAERRG